MADAVSKKERLTKALDAAFDDQVGAFFKTLVAGLIEASSPGSSDTAETVVGRFARGMKLTWSAYERAGDIIEQMQMSP